MEKTRKIQSIIQDVIEGRKDNNEATIDILALCDVSQQSELLTGFVRFERKQDYKYKLLPLSEKIEKYLASL